MNAPIIRLLLTLFIITYTSGAHALTIHILWLNRQAVRSIRQEGADRIKLTFNTNKKQFIAHQIFSISEGCKRIAGEIEFRVEKGFNSPKMGITGPASYDLYLVEEYTKVEGNAQFPRFTSITVYDKKDHYKDLDRIPPENIKVKPTYILLERERMRFRYRIDPKRWPLYSKLSNSTGKHTHTLSINISLLDSIEDIRKNILYILSYHCLYPDELCTQIMAGKSMTFRNDSEYLFDDLYPTSSDDKTDEDTSSSSAQTSPSSQDSDKKDQNS